MIDWRSRGSRAVPARSARPQHAHCTRLRSHTRECARRDTMTAAETVGTNGVREARHADVLGVGGGPAGLSAAEAAARAGARVILLERQKEIGYPVHTGRGRWIPGMQTVRLPAELYY